MPFFGIAVPYGRWRGCSGPPRNDRIGLMAAMKQAALRPYCMSLPGATEQIQWGADRVFKIGGKMFACSGTEIDSRYSFKVEAERFLELTDLDGVAPAPYLARAKWVQIDPAQCQLGDEDIEALVRRSYELVLAKLPKKAQRAIFENG